MADRSKSAWKPVPSEHATLLGIWLTRRGELHRICLYWARGSRSDAEDLLSEAIVRALEADRAGSTDVASPRAWLSAIIANLGRDRRRRVAHEVQLGGEGGEGEPPGSQRIQEEDALHARREVGRMLVEPCGLTSVQRQTLIGRCLGESYRDIASSLRVSEATARKLAQGARQRLKANAS